MCVIHALNLFSGGPIFQYADHFLSIYLSRMSKPIQIATEFDWQRDGGIDVVSLK